MPSDGAFGCGVGFGKGRGGSVVGGDMQVGDDGDGLVEVVDGDDGVEEHEEGLGELEYVFERPCCFRFEVLDAVVADVAYGAASEWREALTGDGGHAAFGEGGLEQRERVLAWAMRCAGLKHRVWVCVWM